MLSQTSNDSILTSQKYSKGLKNIFSFPDSSVIFFNEVIPYLKKNQWNDKYIYSKVGLYLAKKRLGKFEEGFLEIENILSEAKILCGENSKPFAYSANILHLHYYGRGDFQKAIEKGKLALKTFESEELKEKNKLGIAICISNIGSAYLKLGNLEESLKFNLLALYKKKEILKPGHKELLKSYQNLAMIYRELGKYDLTLNNLNLKRKEINRYPFVGSDEMLIGCINSICYTHLLKGNVDSVEYFIDLNDRIQEKNNTNYFPQVKYDLIAQMFEAEGNILKALENKKLMHSLRKKYYSGNEFHLRMAESYSSVAFLYFKSDSINKAIRYLDSAEFILTHGYSYSRLSNLRNLVSAIPILHNKANFHKEKYFLDQDIKDDSIAKRYYLLVDTLIEKVKTGVQNEESKLLFFQQIHPFYESVISYFLSKGGAENLEQAFFFAEKSKASLLQFGLQDLGAKVTSGVPDSLIQREKELKLDIAFYKNLIFREEQKGDQRNIRKITLWRSSLVQKEEFKKTLMLYLIEKYPQYHQLKYSQNIPTIKQVQEKLKGGQVLIEYFYGIDSLYVFSISNKGFDVHKLILDKTFKENIVQLLRELHKPNQGFKGLKLFTESSLFLYQKLLGPSITSYKPKEIIFIPDGPLALIPFEVLLTKNVFIQDEGNSQRVFRHLPYLLQQINCHYEFSVKLFTGNFLRQTEPRKQLVAFAPTYSGNLNLSFNKPQVSEILSITEGDGFLGNTALKSHFLTIGERYKIIHFAGHGFPDTVSSLRSHLLMYDSTGSYTDSSQLFAYDVYNMSLNAELVVLVGCETAFGKVEIGEGVMSLSRAFRHVGSAGVISSLWKADGRSSSNVMSSLYRKIDQGKRVAKSLNDAKQDFLETAPSNQIHPHYWSNFIFYGKNQTLIQHNSNWFFLAVIILFFVLGYFFYRRFKFGLG